MKIAGTLTVSAVAHSRRKTANPSTSGKSRSRIMTSGRSPIACRSNSPRRRLGYLVALFEDHRLRVPVDSARHQRSERARCASLRPRRTSTLACGQRLRAQFPLGCDLKPRVAALARALDRHRPFADQSDSRRCTHWTDVRRPRRRRRVRNQNIVRAHLVFGTTPTPRHKPSVAPSFFVVTSNSGRAGTSRWDSSSPSRSGWT
jgi:hypothetical protein